MKCLQCQQEKTKVVNSRIQPVKGDLVTEFRQAREIFAALNIPPSTPLRIRVRSCPSCGTQFETIEIPMDVLEHFT